MWWEVLNINQMFLVDRESICHAYDIFNETLPVSFSALYSANCGTNTFIRLRPLGYFKLNIGVLYSSVLGIFGLLPRHGGDLCW